MKKEAEYKAIAYARVVVRAINNTTFKVKLDTEIIYIDNDYAKYK